MKTLPRIALVMLFATTLPVHSQTLLNDLIRTRATAFGSAAGAFEAGGRNAGNNLDVRRLDAIMNGLLAHEKHISSSQSVLSIGWARSWWFTKDWSNGAWVNDVQSMFTYDGLGEQLTQWVQTWSDTGWVNSQLSSWTYDDNGNEISGATAGWNSGAWLWSGRETEMYNANGERTVVLWQYLNGIAWVNQSMESYTYDSAGYETGDLSQVWSSGAWMNTDRYTITHNVNGSATNLLWEKWVNSGWVNYGRESASKDASGNKTYSLEQVWSNGSWVNYVQDTFTYDGNSLEIADVQDAWSNSTWVHSALHNLTYDANGNRTDEVVQGWKNNAWVNSWWYIDSWEKVPGIKVTKPTTSEVILAGEPYDITWRSANINSLHIEVSLDGGSTYRTIAASAPATPNHFTWTCDDTALSAKCKIRLSDAGDQTKSITSELFKIHGYIMTRLSANGDYEAFDPQLHGWQFKNRTADMFPYSWSKQFNYSGDGLDPNTGRPYNNSFYSFTVGLVDSDFIDWPLFVRMFGVGSCYENAAEAVYSPVAVRLWSHFKDYGFKGSCYGFAIGSILGFEHPLQLLRKFPEIGDFQNLHDLPLDTVRRKAVNQMYETQYGFPVWQEWESSYSSHTPRTTLDELKSMLRSDSAAHRSLGIFDPREGGGGHAVTPYRMQRDAATGLWNLYVYDCNCQSADCQGVIVIDSLNDSWKYPAVGWMNAGRGFTLHPDPLKCLTKLGLWDPEPPDTSNPDRAASMQLHHVLATSYARLFNSDAAITVTNANGETAGFHDSTTFNGLSDGMPITPETGYFHRPIGYYVPSGAYAVRMYGFVDSSAVFSASEYPRMFTCWRTGADKSQTDFFTYNSGLAIGNPDQQTKNVSLECITKVDSAQRVFQVLNCPAVHNDSLGIKAPDADRLTFVNRGPQKQYGLNIELAGSNGLAQFVHTAITMPANSSHYIVPDWLNLTNQPVRIYEDIGNTGVIHDTLTLANQVTGVKEQLTLGIPQEFRLEQNYPNPFNPSTTIRYGLPVRSHVTLVVFNTLGQQVAVLQDGEQEAGYHEVQFDGTRFASGVYFYRIHSGTFTAVKKFVIVR